jgi:hypothetical protein
MRTRTIQAAATLLAAGALVGWLAVGRLAVNVYANGKAKPKGHP